MKKTNVKKKGFLCSLMFFGLCLSLCMFACTAVHADETAGFDMTNGAYIRVMEDGLTDGIRFEMNMTVEKFEELKAIDGSRSGVLLLPTAMKGESALTVETPDVLNIDTSDKWFRTDSGYSSRVCLTDIGKANYGTAISAVGYVWTEANGYMYTDYSDADNSRSMKQVAIAAISEWESQDPEANYENIYATYNYVIKDNAVNNGIYAADGELYALPDFGEEKPEYTVTGPSGEKTVKNGNKVALDEAGIYTAVMGANTVTFSAFSSENYDKAVAPLAFSQTDYSIRSGNTEYATFEYDAEKDAYKVTPVKAPTNDENSITVDIDSPEYEKIASGCDTYTYLAMDMCFSETAEDMMFWMALEDGSIPQHAYFYGELKFVNSGTGASVSFSEVKADRWYTVYMQTGGLSTLDTYTSYKLFNQRANNIVNSVYWVKNIRFENDIDLTKSDKIRDNYIYQTGETVCFEDDVFGSVYSVSGPSGELILDGENSYTFDEAGDYSATVNGKTITFEVVTPEDFSKIVAPLNSESDQFDGFEVTDPGYMQFKYDDAMQAYKFCRKDGGTFTDAGSCNLKFDINSFAYTQLKNGIGAEAKLLFDICFEENVITYWHEFGGEVGLWHVPIKNSEGVAVLWDNMVAGTWYTFEIPATAEPAFGLMLYRPASADDNISLWLRNIRFA